MNLSYLVFLALGLRDYPFQDWDQWGKRNRSFVPDDVEVNLEVRVNQTVTHSKNGFPRNGGKGLPTRIGDLGRRFPYNLNTLHQPQSRQSVVVEVFLRLTSAK